MTKTIVASLAFAVLVALPGQRHGRGRGRPHAGRLRAAGPAGAALPRQGGCPPGWRESGAYCTAGEDTNTLAIPRTGPCPAGWITSGAYCTRPSK
jgi:hypothetical protein